MNSRFRSLLLLAVWLPLAGCDKPSPPPASAAPVPAPNTAKTEEQLAEARDALQRQALEIETKTALMDKQLADMARTLKDRENAEQSRSLEALKQQNDALREQADAARRQSDAITQRIVATPQPALPPSDYSLFYERLAPFGRWFDVSGYGYCWRPTITTAGWRPYLDGCWVWSSLGWAWQSNEPFGWATYHYGRWVNLAGYGWIWVPGSEWAPAWVAWRQSRDCVGWAPLPPEPGVCSGVYRDCDSRFGLGPTSYIFITTNHFVSPSYTSVCLPAAQRTTVFQNSVNVTQIVRRDDRAHPNVFVHHGGPPRAKVEQACARPVRQVQLQTTRADQAPPPRRGQHREEALSQPVIVELPPARTHGPAAKPDKVESIARPRRLDALAGLPADVAAKVRQTIAEDKAAAVAQQPRAPVLTPAAVVVRPTDEPKSHGRHRPGADVPPLREAVRSTVPAKERVRAETALTPATTTPQAAEPPAPAVIVEGRPVVAASTDSSTTPSQAAEAQAPAVVIENNPAVAAEAVPAVAMPKVPGHSVRDRPVEDRVSVPVVPQTATATSPAVESIKTKPPVTAVVQGIEPGKAPETLAAEVSVPMPVVAPPQTEVGAPPPVTAEKVANEQAAMARAVTEAEKVRALAAEQQAQAAAMQQREQQETQERLKAEKIATEQAAAEAEKVRMQALAAQQQEAFAAQQRAAAEQAQAAAMQQQQEQQRMAAEQAAATAAEAERARQQAESVMQRQQEEASRAAEEQQMRAQQEAAQRAAQEMALRESEEQARRQAEMERRAQEMAQRQAEEQQLRQQQEMAQRRAEEEARRQAEHEMRRAQEMAQRQAEEARRAAEQQMRAQQEAAQRAAQEMVQRQAEEAARRAQEEAQRAAAEAAARAAAEAARNQPPPQNPGQ